MAATTKKANPINDMLNLDKMQDMMSILGTDNPVMKIQKEFISLNKKYWDEAQNIIKKNVPNIPELPIMKPVEDIVDQWVKICTTGKI